MSEPENQLINVRLEKLQRLRDAGVDPYPHSYDRTHTSRQAVDLLEQAEAEHDGEGEARAETVSVGGRIVRYRGMGRATFADIQDGEGKVQLLFRRNNLSESYAMLKELDIGDWIGATGPVFRTRTGEATVEVEDWTVLSKAVRGLPEKWHGLTDVEARFRQRYLDLIANEESLRIAVMRSRAISVLRRFMDGRGFMEVETPMLVQVPAGGTARPFATHHNALDRDLYLRIATELHLKQLVVGGIEKVYEVGRVFRNEGVDVTHNPEFTTMESYEAFADYNDVMEMVEQLVFTMAQEVLGSRRWSSRGLPSTSRRRGRASTCARDNQPERHRLPGGQRHRVAEERNGRDRPRRRAPDELGRTARQAAVRHGRAAPRAAVVPRRLPCRDVPIGQGEA